MPRSAPRPCRAAGCGAVTHDGYCERHKDQRTNWKQYQGGKTTTQRGYGSAWVKLRRWILARDRHLCQPCLEAGRTTTATEVDHIRPKAKGGTDSPTNLRGICTACHRVKTARDGA